MTELEEIRQFMKSRAFQKLSEHAQDEMREQEHALLEDAVVSALRKYVEPLFEGSDESFSYNISYSKDNGMKIQETQSPKDCTPAAGIVAEPSLLSKENTFSVTFDDGSVVVGKDSLDTFLTTLSKIGLMRIPELNITFGRINLVSAILKDESRQVEKEGVYVYCDLDDDDMMGILSEISELLNLNLTIKCLTDNTLAADSVEEDSDASSSILLTPDNADECSGRDLRITYNGKVFFSKNAKNEFINTLKEIGLDRIPEVGIICSGYNLVDRRKRTDGDRVWQEHHDGYWIYIYFSNPTKVKYLHQIADYYHLDIKIEAVEK